MASRDAGIGELKGGSKKLATRDRYHNGPHSPVDELVDVGAVQQGGGR